MTGHLAQAQTQGMHKNQQLAQRRQRLDFSARSCTLYMLTTIVFKALVLRKNRIKKVASTTDTVSFFFLSLLLSFFLLWTKPKDNRTLQDPCRDMAENRSCATVLLRERHRRRDRAAGQGSVLANHKKTLTWRRRKGRCAQHDSIATKQP